MLLEQGKIADEFAPILQKSGLLIHSGAHTPLVPLYYWSLFDANHRATFNLGAMYSQAINNRFQLLDVEYYVSGNYYAAATLYEIWPINNGEETGSIVWRGDFFAAPMLKYTKGIERIAYGAIMVHEIKNEISYFRDSLKIKAKEHSVAPNGLP